MKLVTFSNLGNTCYINSVLHAFIYHSENELFKQIRSLIVIDHDSELETTVYNLTDFIKIFTSKFPHFYRFQQHDAHEFVMSLIELTDDKSFIGNTVMKIQCDSCKNTNNVNEEFSSIDLSVPDSKEPVSIFDLFENYLGSEVIKEYFCDSCNNNVIGNKKVFLWKLPKKLIIVLKRYSCCGEKIRTHVEYPETLKIRESSSNEVINYTLTCVVNHIGGIHDGHYNSFVKLNDKWYFMDDDICLEKDSIKTNNSYILFYQR